MSKIYKEELIHDKDCRDNVFFTVKAKYESVINELDEIKEEGYTYRGGKRVEGIKLKHLIHDLKVEAEILEYCMKDAEKYKIIE